MVATFRNSGPPIPAAASASTPYFSRTTGEDMSAWIVVVAPMAIPPSASVRTPDNSVMPLRPMM